LNRLHYSHWLQEWGGSEKGQCDRVEGKGLSRKKVVDRRREKGEGRREKGKG
jgi:hypothetical protein